MTLTKVPTHLLRIAVHLRLLITRHQLPAACVRHAVDAALRCLLWRTLLYRLLGLQRRWTRSVHLSALRGCRIQAAYTHAS